MDSRMEQLFSQMEELTQTVRQQKQHNETQERINRQLLEAFNAVRASSERNSASRKTKGTEASSKGKARVGDKESSAERSGRSHKRNRAENGGRSRRMTRTSESSDESYTPEDCTPTRGRTMAEHSQPARRRNRDRTNGSNAARPSGRTNDWYDDVSDTPFEDWITSVNTPAGFSAPKFTLYDGGSDPRDHLIHFKQAMVPTCIQQSKRDAVMCKVFASSLKGSALLWFSRLPARSIDSFSALSQLFLTQFASSRQYRKDPDDLFRVQQQSGEPLRDYIQRFNDRKVEILECPEVVACNAFKRGLLPGTKIYDYMVRKKPTNLLQTLQKAQTFVVLEEETRLDMQRAVKEGRINPSTEGESSKQHIAEPSTRNFDSRPVRPEGRLNDQTYRGPRGMAEQRRKDERNGPTRDRLRKFGLTVSPAQVVAQMERINEVRWPQPLNLDPKKKDSSKWCVFHRERGHGTEDCRAFKREIEELLKRGYLRQFVSDPDKWGPDAQKEGVPQKPPLPQRNNEVEIRRVINSVHGGLACGGERRDDRRAYARLPIAQVTTVRRHGPHILFTNEDSDGVVYPHGDALVVTLDVGNCTVKRILVDNGSSADIIFLSTIEKMGISPTAVLPSRATLVGYDGNESLAKGKITIPITAKGKTVMAELMVVDAPSAYNMILGRPWLHSMEAIPSTFHQKIKFPFREGVEELKSDQAAARICYVTTVDGKNK